MQFVPRSKHYPLLQKPAILCFSSFLFRRVFIQTHFGCGGLLSYLITLNDTHTTIGGTPLDEGSAHHRDFYLTKQHSQGTEIHTPGGIRTRNPSKRAAADPRLRPRGHPFNDL